MSVYDNPTCICGRPLRKPKPDEGIDVDWVHADNADVFCQEVGYVDETGAWNDPDYAQPAAEESL